MQVSGAITVSPGYMHTLAVVQRAASACDARSGDAARFGSYLQTAEVTPKAPYTSVRSSYALGSGEVFTAADGTRFTVQVVATGLENPWSIAFAPDGRLFVTERPGRVRIIQGDHLLPEPALVLPDVLYQGQGGLLGLALHPHFAVNRFVYLFYSAQSAKGGVNRVVRYREVGNRLAEAAVVLDDIPFASTQNGGRIKFGPDGYVYVTTGDTNVPSLAQDVSSLAGKILRLSADGMTPPGNRFTSLVWSWGHHNPQGIDWHPSTGDLWSTEHGAGGHDELNQVDGGQYYGWSIADELASQPYIKAAVARYTPSIEPSGAAFYTGPVFPTFQENLFIATLDGTHLRRIRFDPGDPRRVLAEERLLQGRFGRLRDVVMGPDGALYFCTSNRDALGTSSPDDDRILRIVATP